MPPVSAAAMTASRSTSAMASETNTDWSNSGVIFMSFGAAALICGRKVFTVSTTDSVEAVPFFSTVSRTAGWWFDRTTFCCGGDPSRTQATSRIRTGLPCTTLIGISLKLSTASGEAFSRDRILRIPDLDEAGRHDRDSAR